MAKIIDFHSHILPAMDHGCRDLSQSLAQLSLMTAGGADAVVASSHFYPGIVSLSDFVKQREAAAKQLAQNLPEHAPRIAVGAEVYCTPGLENATGLEALCVAGTRCLLLEMPLDNWRDAHFETVDALSCDGFAVVMAHIDRYPPKDVEALMQLNVYAQVNASSLCSFFRRGRTKKWFEEDRVVALGSDLHGSEKGGYDHFSRALRILGEDTVRRVMAHSEELLGNAVYLK